MDTINREFLAAPTMGIHLPTPIALGQSDNKSLEKSSYLDHA